MDPEIRMLLYADVCNSVRLCKPLALRAVLEDYVAGVVEEVDIVVAGGGNAALCAAIEARQAGLSVLVLEAASKFYRGGNTRHTRNCRVAHDMPIGVMHGAYAEDEFWDDLLRVTGEPSKPARTASKPSSMAPIPLGRVSRRWLRS